MIMYAYGYTYIHIMKNAIRKMPKFKVQGIKSKKCSRKLNCIIERLLTKASIFISFFLQYASYTVIFHIIQLPRFYSEKHKHVLRTLTSSYTVNPRYNGRYRDRSLSLYPKIRYNRGSVISDGNTGQIRYIPKFVRYF